MHRLLVGSLGLLLTVAVAAEPRNEARKARPLRAPVPGPPAAVDPAAVNDPSLTDLVGPGSAGSAVLRAQVLLDRAHFSPGEIDAKYGNNLRKAITAYQGSRGLPSTGRVDPATWSALDQDPSAALVVVTISPETAAGPFTPRIPEEMDEKARLPMLNYSSPLEAIGEEFHVRPALLRDLNPSATFERAGEQILVPNVKVSPSGPAASVVVSRSDESVTALNGDGKILAYYPATIGSRHDPLPLGRWKIQGVSRNPPFHYNPKLFWDAKPSDENARIPPGPKNPVGVVWIDLSEEHYGIHGTPEPSQIGRTESHGCIRLTNWSAWELAGILSPGIPAILQE